MRLTFWQFVGIILCLGGLYAVYHYWWLDQDPNSWIRKFNSSVYDSENELEEKQEPLDPNAGWL